MRRHWIAICTETNQLIYITWAPKHNAIRHSFISRTSVANRLTTYSTHDHKVYRCPTTWLFISELIRT